MGCFQKEGVDYTDTYASVMATRTFRYLLQLFNSKETHSMEHWDVSTAFIHAPLKEQVWMKQATGHEEKEKENWVCLLLKPSTGLSKLLMPGRSILVDCYSLKDSPLWC